MKIINNTCWRTDHLRAIAMRIAKAELGSEKRARLILTFNAARQQNYCSGHAYLNGRHAFINIPTMADPDKVDLASLVAHELAHIRGKRDEKWMRSRACFRYGRMSGKQREFYAWVHEMPLERKPIKPKPSSIELAEKRLAEIDDLLKSWETKKKRAETYLKKYHLQHRYYEKRIAALCPSVSD